MTDVDLMDAELRARIERVKAARAAVLAAQAAEEQAVRDVLADRALSVSRLTREAYGRDNRQRVYAILGRGPEGNEPARPQLPPVVYLRGAGMPDTLWSQIEQAMWARGWFTERDRDAAWHLARGGATVATLDFSRDLYGTEPARGGGLSITGQLVHVARVRARYAELPDGSVEHELAVVVGGLHERPEHPDRSPDVQAMALLVADVLA